MCGFVCVCVCGAVILVAHFLQSVSSGLVLGGELVYHRGRAEEGGILTLAGQYSGLFHVPKRMCLKEGHDS